MASRDGSNARRGTSASTDAAASSELAAWRARTQVSVGSLLLTPEETASDGSDYAASDEEDDESIDSENDFDMEIDRGLWTPSGEFHPGAVNAAETPMGSFYQGALVNGALHGQCICRFPTGEGESGDVHRGEWVDGLAHGKGICEYENGNVYDGEWVEGRRHGRGTIHFAYGGVYEGEWKEDKINGRGKMSWANGRVYDGEWASGEMHGRGKMTDASGIVHEGQWVDGKAQAPRQPQTKKLIYIERQPRSQRSQQQRLQKKDSLARRGCEHCGLDDVRYKLRVCSGCNLALYCSAACQQAASRSHRRICDVISELQPRDANTLVLTYDKEKMVDFDAGLRYGTKYMDNLKYLAINIIEWCEGDAIKLSEKQLSSLLRSKKGSLVSVFWSSNEDMPAPRNLCGGGGVWMQLHGLKQLRLECMEFDDFQSVLDTISQQKDTLEVLCLPLLAIDWHNAKSRRAFAQAVNECKHLVKLDLQGCGLMDSDLKVMLQGLPNLRNLNLRNLHLKRDDDTAHEFTDNTCGLIARNCPDLQELCLDNHDQLSARGIRKIFEGCRHLRAFYTTTRKLSYKDIRSLLDIAPQLMYLSLLSKDFSIAGEELTIEATGGRTVLWSGMAAEAGKRQISLGGVSSTTRERYERQKDLLCDILSRWSCPDVANEWAEMFEG